MKVRPAADPRRPGPLAWHQHAAIPLRLPAAFDLPGDSFQRYWYLALVAAILVACVYLTLIASIDNTNLGTTNGLWKSIQVTTWEHGGETGLDSGGFLYFKTYGFLARVIPDRLVQYGTPPPMVTFRKMALLNGLFGGIASGFVFLFALRITSSRFAALVVLVAHSGAAFILLNSINSEDIMPAYALFVAATAGFVEFLRSGKIWLMGASAALLALAALFHWTVMLPALAGYAAVFGLIIILKDKRYILIGAAWLFLFLCTAQLTVLLVFPKQHIPIWAIILPAKANAGGWVGFHAEKLLYFFIGLGNYFSGGANVADYTSAYHGRTLHHMLISWTYFLATLGICIWTLFRRQAAFSHRCLAAFAITLFMAGQAGNLYSQPQDPQMQIEPMFATITGVALLGSWLTNQSGKIRLWGGLCILLVGANSLWNVQLMRAGTGGDRQAIATIQEMERLFPRKDTVIVCVGFEGWTTWQYVLLWPNDSEGYFGRNFHLARPFTNSRGITGFEAATSIRQQIDEAFAHGLRVVAAALWTEQPAAFIRSLLTVADENQARSYDAGLRDSYRLGTRWQTHAGLFVELLPKPTAGQP